MAQALRSSFSQARLGLHPVQGRLVDPVGHALVELAHPAVEGAEGPVGQDGLFDRRRSLGAVGVKPGMTLLAKTHVFEF